MSRTVKVGIVVLTSGAGVNVTVAVNVRSSNGKAVRCLAV